MGEKILYLCDPKKAILCKKTNCKYNKKSVNPVCDRTFNIEYAVCDEKGMPVVVEEENIERCETEDMMSRLETGKSTINEIRQESGLQPIPKGEAMYLIRKGGKARMLKAKRLMEKNVEEGLTNMILEEVVNNNMTISNVRKVTENVIECLEANAILEMEDSNNSESPSSPNQ